MASADANKKSRVVSPRSTLKKVKSKMSEMDPMAKYIMGFFDESLKKEFTMFLAEKASNVVPISKAKSSKSKKEKERGEYNKAGKEPISFREMTSYNNPKFSTPGKFSPSESNPESIDIDTFDLMRRDVQLGIGLSIIKMPIISLPWRIDCEDEKIRKTVEWALGKIWRDLIKSSLMAIDYGFATHEKVWERDNVKISKIDKDGKEEIYHKGDLVYYKKIKPNHPGTIKMKFDEKQELEAVIQESSFGVGEIILPIRKVFLFTNDKEFGNPFGTSRLKNAYKVWYWNQLLYQFMMQYFERRGTPPTIATVPPGRSQDSSGGEIDNLELGLRMAASLVSSSVAVLPYQQSRDGKENMWGLNLLNDDARGPMFIEALSHMDARCLRALFVPEGIISGDSGGGGYSGSSVHADVFLMSQKGLITDLEESVDQQIILPFIEANYPPEERVECSIKLDPLDFSRKITIKEIFMEMIRNQDTMMQMGINPKIIPSIEKMADTLEIPVESWKSATGLEEGELMDIMDDRANPVGANIDEMGNDPNAKDENEKPIKTDKKNDKLAGRKKTRARSVDQTIDRSRINQGSRRAERKRDSTSRTKENG